MATWDAHLRIAQSLSEKFPALNSENFLVGNIGPDCSMPNEDWTEFNPSKKITHWMNDENKIDAEKFYNTHLNFELKDIKKYSFLLGYYSHLLTDIEWNYMFNKKKQETTHEPLKTDERFIWSIKEDWYELDFIYFDKNKNSIFHTIFKDIQEFSDYLDYYPTGSIIRQITYITHFYLEHNADYNREFKYLTEYEMDEFIECTTSKLYEIIKPIIYQI